MYIVDIRQYKVYLISGDRWSTWTGNDDKELVKFVDWEHDAENNELSKYT